MALDEPGLEGETPNARSASTPSSARIKAFTERMSMLRFLVYHRIADNQRGDFRAIHPDAFRRHLEMIEAAGIPVIDPRGLTLPADPVSGIVLTFDDATMDHFSTAR